MPVKEVIHKLLSKVSGSLKAPSGPGLDTGLITAYNAARGKPTSSHICHAPFSNMYFNVHGDCAPCWLTFIDPDSYPDKSVRDIWFGEKYQALRKNLLNYNLTDKCNVCLKNLQNGNYTSLLARAYDVNEVAEYPAMMELELNNTCNLECVMCIGELSSSIRKNREKRPPVRSPYDEKFVQQLEEFIPHLKELRFNGGEPFLIGIVFKIFEKVEKLNPGLKIVIATNGTVLNYKVKEWLCKLNIHINLSIDSLTPDIYESIRVNAHFDRLMEHFEFYRDYCRANRRTLCVMVNPMRNNWHEMPEFIRFVNKHQVNIWFNTIHRPVEYSIWALPSQELEKICSTLSAVEFNSAERSGSLSAYNIGLYRNLVNVQFANWWAESKQRTEIPGVSDSAPLNEEEAVMVLQKNITDYVYLQFNEGEEQKKYRIQRFMEKIHLVKSKVKQTAPEAMFFMNVLQIQPEQLFKAIEEGDPDKLAAQFLRQFS